jgi:phosphatidylglycerophosphate synthase
MESFAKDTDGFFARHFDRKISGAVSRQLLKTPVTPNQITVFVTLLGIGAGWLMAQPGDVSKIEGSLVFLLTSILDGCDGEVARAKKMTSTMGGWLDLWGDNVVHVAVFYGLGLGLYKDTGRGVYLVLGKFAVLGTIVSASLASYQTYLKMRVPSPPPSPDMHVGRGRSEAAGEGQSLFTSVIGDVSRVHYSSWRSRLTSLADALARRDFIYGVVFLALLGHLEWFLWPCAIGSNIYALVLVILFFSTR